MPICDILRMMRGAVHIMLRDIGMLRSYLVAGTLRRTYAQEDCHDRRVHAGISRYG